MSIQDNKDVRFIEYRPPIPSSELEIHIGQPAFLAYKADGVTTLLSGVLTFTNCEFIRIGWGALIPFDLIEYISVAIIE